MASRTYRIFWNAFTKDPPGGVAVTADIPAAWTEDIDGTGSPTFTVPGLGSFSQPAITAIAANGADDRARIESTAATQFGDALATAQRADRDGGRVWIVARRSTGHVHARMFIPAAAPGVVVASVMLDPGEAAKLAEIERAFESVRVVR